MLVDSCDIHENRCSESRSLQWCRKGNFAPIFLHFSSDLEEVSTGNVHKSLFIDFKARKSRHHEDHTLLSGRIYISVSSFLRDLYLMILNVCEFRENRRREGCNFLMDVKEI